MGQQEQDSEQMVNLADFATMAGFPLELVKKELFEKHESSDQVSMSRLREFMIKYLDKTMAQ